jgi:hypothetical protein
MVRSYAFGFAALFALLVVSVGLKFANTLVSAQPDIQRMRLELVSVLKDRQYTITLPQGEPKWWNDGLVIGRKSNCEVFLRDATYFGPELETISSRRMNSGRPLRYIWGGEHITNYPRLRIEVQWRIQRELARLGWRYGIDPVIAVGTPQNCWPDPTLFENVQIYYQA